MFMQNTANAAKYCMLTLVDSDSDIKF